VTVFSKINGLSTVKTGHNLAFGENESGCLIKATDREIRRHLYSRCYGSAVPTRLVTPDSQSFIATQQLRQTSKHLPGGQQPVRHVHDLAVQRRRLTVAPHVSAAVLVTVTTRRRLARRRHCRRHVTALMMTVRHVTTPRSHLFHSQQIGSVT